MFQTLERVLWGNVPDPSNGGGGGGGGDDDIRNMEPREKGLELQTK